MNAATVVTPYQSRRTGFNYYAKRTTKRVVPTVLAIYFVPVQFAVFFALGLIDFLRNKRRTLKSFDRYFAGNGFCTWLLCPFNLLVDLLTLPYSNKGVYRLSDLPQGHQDEINALIEAAHRSDLVAKLNAKVADCARGMIFFKWYGANLQASVDVPEFHQKFKYIRTIGVSVFNKKQSTVKHFGPLRVTLRVLYNINRVKSPDVYIKVGGQIHRWCENPLFIFDDTLQHKSVNQSDEVRYCMFVDILRPSYCPRLMSCILAGVRMVSAPFQRGFYKHWTVVK